MIQIKGDGGYNSCKLFFIFKNIKYDIFEKKNLIIFYYFYLFSKYCFRKIIIQIYGIIKNKTLDIKIIFKAYLKILKIS